MIKYYNTYNKISSWNCIIKIKAYPIKSKLGIKTIFNVRKFHKNRSKFKTFEKINPLNFAYHYKKLSLFQFLTKLLLIIILDQ